MRIVAFGVKEIWTATPQSMHDSSRGRDSQGVNRVIRGSSWNDNARNVRAAYRNWNHAGNRNDNLGFRLALARRRQSPTPTQSRSCLLRLTRSGKILNGFWCAGSATEVTAKARQNPLFPP